MVSTYVRLGLLTAVCLISSRGESQDAALGYGRYGTQNVNLPAGPAPYGYAPTSPTREPQISYPQTLNSPSPYGGVRFPSTPPHATAFSPVRTPSTAMPDARYSVMSVTTPTAAYQPQYSGAGGAFPAGIEPMPGAPLPIPAEPYYGASGDYNSFAGCDEFGCAAPSRQFFMTYDYLYWAIAPPKASRIGSTQLEGDYTRGGVTTHFENSLDTSFLDAEFHSGHRVEFGARDCCTGWLVGFAYGQQSQGLTSNSVNFLPGDPGFPVLSQSYLAGYSDGNGDGFDDDLNSNSFHGRFGQDVGTSNGAGGFVLPLDGTPDVPAPTDTGDLQIYLPVFTRATVQNTVTLSNLEVMHLTRMNRDPSSDFEFLYGARYLDLQDYFAFSGTGGTLDATSVAVTAKNQLLGFQVGARWRKSFGVWALNAEGRFLAAANIQDNKMYGNVASNILTNSNGQNGPVNLSPQAFNYASSNNEWAPLGELRLQAILPINDCCAFRLGYTGFVVSGISRASQKVDYVLPRFGMNQSASNETIVFNSFNLGFEFNR